MTEGNTAFNQGFLIGGVPCFAATKVQGESSISQLDIPVIF